MNKSEVAITTPGVVAAASILHKAKATRPAIDAVAARAESLLRVTPKDHPSYAPTQRDLSDAVDACRHNTATRIDAAVRLVEAARLELLEAVFDAADDGWSLRELANVASVSRGTIANILEAGGVKTARAAARTPTPAWRHLAGPDPRPEGSSA